MVARTWTAAAESPAEAGSAGALQESSGPMAGISPCRPRRHAHNISGSCDDGETAVAAWHRGVPNRFKFLIVNSLEGWLSGLRHSTRNRAWQ